MKYIAHTRLLRVVAIAGMAFTIACGGEEAAPVRTVDLAPAVQSPPQLADVPEPAATPAPAPPKAAAPRSAQPRRGQPPAPPATQTEVPAATAPVVTATAAPAPPPAPTTGTIAAGVGFAVKPSAKLCTSTHKPGDRFTAALAAPLTGSNGAEIPAGSVAVLRIVEDAGSSDSTRLAYDLISIRVGDQTYEVSAHVTQSAPLERINTQTGREKATKIGAGAAIGAIAGRVLGGNTKSTVIGGAIGAAAGAAVARADRKVDGCLREDGTITLSLDKPLTIRLPQAP